MRLLICAGGTGGGVYPALAVLQALQSGDANNAGHLDEAASTLTVLWVGSEDGMEKDLIQRTSSAGGSMSSEAIRYAAIPAAGVHGVGWRTLPGNLLRLAGGLLASLRILRRFRPDVLLFTGGYVAVPMALAARIPQPGLSRPRSLVYVPDIEPGLALKVIARLADRIAATAEDTKTFFPGRRSLHITGYPLRRELAQPASQQWDKLTARRMLGLAPDLPVLLVSGGSKGARSINQALMAILPDLLAEMQVVHISGQLDWEQVQARAADLPAGLAERYHAFPYLHEQMGAALAASDLAVMRAGASVLGELPYFGVPAVLVPYPYAWRYQRVNAEYLVQRGAAVLLPDGELAARLRLLVDELMGDATRRAAMTRAMQALRQPGSAQELAGILNELSVQSNFKEG